MLFRLFTVLLLISAVSGAYIRLYPAGRCRGNYYQCNNTPANFCCYRRSPALKSAGIFGKPKASRSAIYARVTNQNRCAKQVQIYRGDRVNACIGSVNGQSFSFAGAAYFPVGQKKRDVAVEERAAECNDGQEADVAVIGGSMYRLVDMAPALIDKIDAFMTNGSSAADLPTAFKAFATPIPASQIGVVLEAAEA